MFIPMHSIIGWTSFLYDMQMACSGSWCADSRLSPLLVKLPQILEWILSDNPLIPFSAHLFLPHFFLPLRFLWICFDKAIWTTSFFNNVRLWLTLVVEFVSDVLLDICEFRSFSHDCVAYWPRLRDHLKAHETFASVLR